jgi:outer membrane protein OmpA-like peptidoglycan-associated protein
MVSPQRFVLLVLSVILVAFAVSISGLSSASAEEVQFIGSPPLSSAVKESVKACAPMSVLQVPVITWGGDVATVLAAGGKTISEAGSLFDAEKLKVKLQREDVFANQLKNYLSCQSPFLRGTMGMMNLATDVTGQDPRTRMIVIYQMTWSAGGDALVVKSSIKSPKDLKGKTVALQAYGPHVDYLTKILRDAGLSMRDVNIRWVKDLTGTKQTPKAALAKGDIDAAMVVTPDALALTSNGTVGTGSEDSIKGARILLSTKTASRVIADVYAVRADYYEANKSTVEAFVRALLAADLKLAAMVKKGSSDPQYKKVIAGAAQILLDSEKAVADTEAMYKDAAMVGWSGNQRFFKEPNNPRSFENLNKEIGEAFVGLGLVSKAGKIEAVHWDWNALKKGASASQAEAPRFDPNKLAQVVTRKAQEDKLGEGELFAFEVNFKPNQNAFSTSAYSDAFNKAIKLAATYGGAVITIEGHSDPLAYLRRKKDGATQVELNRIRQSAKNLALTRANGVRDSLLAFAKQKGLTLDASQFAVVGHGIDRPKSGLCGADPCAPASEKAWLGNMRVEFRIIQVEAEESVFKSI